MMHQLGLPSIVPLINFPETEKQWLYTICNILFVLGSVVFGD